VQLLERRIHILGNSGDVYEQAVVKTVAGFFRGNPTHLFGVTRFGATVVYVPAGFSHRTYFGLELTLVSPDIAAFGTTNHAKTGFSGDLTLRELSPCLCDGLGLQWLFGDAYLISVSN
jgi:hypothetical protein